MKAFLPLLILICNTVPFLFAQHKEYQYMPATDPLVQNKLEEWQDLKFGLMMTWGPCSQWGVVESWSICSEDEPWCQRKMVDYVQYKKDYESLKHTFNPIKFDPVRWARAAKSAGIKYVVGMAKHHDGFCMFDTRTTDYKITDAACPFSKNPKSNILKEILDAFRVEGFWAGIYFSKPDWHTEFYWWPYFATPDRHVNYDPEKYPERWQKFKDFSYSQIEELMKDYGKIDIFWLDGAWVRPIENMPDEYVSWAKKKNWNQDIDMDRIANMARKHQPGLIVVDRWVSGEFENYLTPENRVPEKMIPYPWESCITSGGGWSYNPESQYKSVHQLLQILLSIVAKGGNLLLNIGPAPDGTWDENAYDRLEKIGKWMNVNSEAIYATRPIAPYQDGKVYLSRKKNTDTVYAIYLADEDETNPPAKIWLNSIQPVDNSNVTMLGVESFLEWEKVGKGFLIEVPESIQKNPPCQHAWTIKITKIVDQ
jgi:alpha-L-fucosidase